MSNAIEWSEIEVEEVRNKSRLITCKNVQPLKILNPESHSKTCHVVLSSYGGGMVSGDNIKIKIRGGINSNLFISSQANTKIFKSIDGANAEQSIEGKLEETSFVVVFPDPIVPQESSKYRQSQHWQLKESSLLLILDWLNSGRTDVGERYLFDSFFSEVKVAVKNKPIVIDRFSFDPKTHIAKSSANFAGYQTVLSAYLVGNEDDIRFKELAETFLNIIIRNKSKEIPQYLCSVSKSYKGSYIFRAAANNRLDLQTICEELALKLSEENLLGFNPLKRKY